MKYLRILSLLGLLFVAACGSKTWDSYPELKNAALIVIAHDSKGKVEDFRVIQDSGAIHSITVVPSGGGREIFLTLLGTKRHESLLTFKSFGTRDAVGNRGTLEVVIEDGVAVSVAGDNELAKSPVKKEAFETMAASVAAGRFFPAGKSLITIGQ